MSYRWFGALDQRVLLDAHHLSSKTSAGKSGNNGGYGSGDMGYGGGSNDGGYGKTSGTHIVETKIETTYTTVVGLQPAEQAPAAAPSYGNYKQTPKGYAQ